MWDHSLLGKHQSCPVSPEPQGQPAASLARADSVRPLLVTLGTTFTHIPPGQCLDTWQYAGLRQHMQPPMPFLTLAETPSDIPLSCKFLETVPTTLTCSQTQRRVQVLKSKRSYLHTKSQPHTDLPPCSKSHCDFEGSYSFLFHGPLSPLKNNYY